MLLRFRRGLAALLAAGFVLSLTPGHLHAGAALPSNEDPDVPASQTHHHDHGAHEHPESDADHEDDACPGCLCPLGSVSCGALIPTELLDRASTPSVRRDAPTLTGLAPPLPPPHALFRPPRGSSR
jgi:hypothetical protein